MGLELFQGIVHRRRVRHLELTMTLCSVRTARIVSTRTWILSSTVRLLTWVGPICRWPYNTAEDPDAFHML
jgi:hypothetical protein